MTTNRTSEASLLNILLAGCLGALIGGVVVYAVMSWHMERGVELFQADTLSSTVATLQMLRQQELGRGIDQLESRLDGSLVIFYDSAPKTEEAKNAIKQAREYRRKFPLANTNPISDRVLNK